MLPYTGRPMLEMLLRDLQVVVVWGWGALCFPSLPAALFVAG